MLKVRKSHTTIHILLSKVCIPSASFVVHRCISSASTGKDTIIFFNEDKNGKTLLLEDYERKSELEQKKFKNIFDIDMECYANFHTYLGDDDRYPDGKVYGDYGEYMSKIKTDLKGFGEYICEVSIFYLCQEYLQKYAMHIAQELFDQDNECCNILSARYCTNKDKMKFKIEYTKSKAGMGYISENEVYQDIYRYLGELWYDRQYYDQDQEWFGINILNHDNVEEHCENLGLTHIDALNHMIDGGVSEIDLHIFEPKIYLSPV